MGVRAWVVVVILKGSHWLNGIFKEEPGGLKPQCHAVSGLCPEAPSFSSTGASRLFAKSTSRLQRRLFCGSHIRVILPPKAQVPVTLCPSRQVRTLGRKLSHPTRGSSRILDITPKCMYCLVFGDVLFVLFCFKFLTRSPIF